MTHSTIGLRVAQPATYRIRIQGTLDESWADYFGGLRISQIQLADQAPLTVLTGQVLDQVMLLSILNRLCDLGLPIRSVEGLVEQ